MINTLNISRKGGVEMAVREIIKNKKYKIELFIGRNGNKKIMHYEVVEGGKKEAELRESELKIQLKNHTFVKNNSLTINDLMKEYIKYKQDKWSPRTKEANKHRLNNIINKLGYIKLQDINVKMLEDFYQYLKNDKQYSDQSILLHYNIISNAFDKAIQWGYITTNENKKIERPKVRKKEIECYSPEEVIELVKVLKNESLKYQSVILLALDSGIRRGELTGLNWEDIDFKSGTINVNKATQYTKETGIFEKETKTATSDRKIYISNTTLNILKKFKVEQMEKKIKLGNKWGNSKRVFTTDFGYDMHPDTPSQIFETIIKKYNLKRITFHALRHTSISLMISKGIQVQVISKKAGHSSVQVTHNTYSHFFDSEFKKCASEMDNILQEAN